jgi:hypothetical protein
MAKKKIISVAAELANDDIEYCNFDSDASLLDWDIILFKPVIDEFANYSDHYQGKPSLSDSSSFRLRAIRALAERNQGRSRIRKNGYCFFNGPL